MARQLRIEYPGAFYHVYSRGNQKQPIFFTDDDRYYFLKILGDAYKRLHAIVHLYCLMNSHYHLGMETPQGNLSQIMHFINSAYSIYVNLKHGRYGHLFQGRFKAILVQADTYARTLTIYIHENPSRKGIVERPEQYEWSSCREYFGVREPPRWLETRTIIGCFGGSRQALLSQHEDALLLPGESAAKKELQKAFRTGILGEPDFIDQVRRTYLKERMASPDGELWELRRLRVRPELSQIKIEATRELGAENRLVKACVIFVAHTRGDYKLKEIGAFFGIGPAATSVAFKRAQGMFISNATLRRVADAVVSRLSLDKQKRIC